MDNKDSGPIELVTLEERARLEEIRQEFERNNTNNLSFPKGLCRKMAEAVEIELGLRRVGGIFRLKNGFCTHEWNTTPQGGIVDISGDQFGGSIPPVYVARIDERYKTY
ncbi:MAG: hypothetical protein NUV97_03640 [archaeon]|nr:hypothetical protein [archaeon]MCR4323890.1 hypothetical protein [Nanoarchaeota archaeon]